MKSGKAVGPDDIPVEVWKCLGEAAVEFLANLFNRVLESERMPEEWRRSVLVPIFKNKGDVQSCSNYRGIKLMSHTMKVWERVVESRLRKVVEICEQQYGFMPRKSTTDAIFALRILMEKYRDGQKELHCVFVDLEKAYDRVPREELWYCMRKSGVAEKYVRVVQDMYERSRTVVRCAVGQTEEFNVEVGLHQGSALSPFLFAIVMDQLSEEVRQESPWTMMFADDIVICSESREQVEENLERWRFALERRGMKVSRSKTEYMCVNEREGSGTVRLQGEEVKKVQEFKYLGSTVQSNGECGKEVKKRVQAGWNGWRKVWGVLCDQKISARIKGKVYRTVVRPAMLYGLETVSLRKRQESELEVAELKMLRFSLGVTRLDRIRNEYIRGTAHVGCLGDKVREARLRWFGHVQRRERRRRETFVFPQDELTYNRELSDYEDDDNWPAQQNEAGDGGEHEVWTRNPSPDRSPSPLMRGLSPIWTPPPVRTPSPVRSPSPLRTPSPVRSPSPLRTPSPVRRPSPLRTPSPVRRPSPLRTPSPVRRSSPLRRPPSSGNPHRSTVPLPQPHVQINPHHIVAGQHYVRATMTVPVPRQGIRRRRDEEDGNEEAPQSRRQRVDPDGEVDFIRRIVRFPVQLISIYLRELLIHTGDSMADSVEPLFTHEVVDEGDDVTLSCKFETIATGFYLHWYRQYPKSKPDFLLYIHQSKYLSPNIPPRMSAKVHGDKQVDLIISSAAVSDSALYYCALQP
ncbi:hypothetical protein QTP86_001882 [Hemibagrus guttatus]|nr:hypothetical protein QTP86_001882 [Hemibagrus guttatus]